MAEERSGQARPRRMTRPTVKVRAATARVSVIVPSYNYGRFIARALDSAFSQTCPPAEVIVVDDGSTDDTNAVLARYGNNVRVLRQVRLGVSAARNAGIRAARADWIALLDADDAWHPEKLAHQLSVAEDDPGVGAVGCALEVVEADGTRRPPRYFPDPSPDPILRLRQVATRTRWVGGSCSGALLPRRVLEDVGGFAEDLAAAEDWDLWLRIAARHRIRNVHAPLTTIHFHRTGTFRDPVKWSRSQWQVYRLALERWPEALDEETRRRVRALIHADLAGEHAGIGQVGKALRRSIDSLRDQPYQPTLWTSMARLVGKHFVG